jgi:hypothetical protein
LELSLFIRTFAPSNKINIKSTYYGRITKHSRSLFIIRGYRVMLDFDLAELYEVKTKALNQAVKRNSKRFEGEEFMFQLSKDEWISFTKSVHTTIPSEANDTSISDDYNLRSQIVTSRFSNNWGGNRTQPYAFTEIGVAMLSGILDTERHQREHSRSTRCY